MNGPFGKDQHVVEPLDIRLNIPPAGSRFPPTLDVRRPGFVGVHHIDLRLLGDDAELIAEMALEAIQDMGVGAHPTDADKLRKACRSPRLFWDPDRPGVDWLTEMEHARQVTDALPGCAVQRGTGS